VKPQPGESSAQAGAVRLLLRCSTTVSKAAPPQVEAVTVVCVHAGQVTNQ
jgi:hypothetical protein